MKLSRHKADSYRFCYAHRRIIWLLWWMLLGVAVGSYLAFIRLAIVARHGVWAPRIATTAVAVTVVALISSLPWLLFSGLFYVWFRYLARWAAHVAGVTRRVQSARLLRAMLQLAAVALATWGYYRLQDQNFHAKQLLAPTTTLKIIAITALLRLLWWAFETSSHLVILPFSNYGGDALKVSADGIATRLLSELTGLA